MTGTHVTRSALVVTSLALWLGCSKKDAGTGDTGLATNRDTGASAAMSDTGMTSTPVAGLSDANIFYLLDRANVMDSAGGAVASTKGTNSEVREFGQLMIRDHHDLRQKAAELAKKLAITLAPPPNDTTQAHMDKMMSTLNGVAKGRDFDKAYIDNEVEAHKAVLETVVAAAAAAQNPELTNLIQKAAPTIQAHLDRAQSIQTKINQ